LTESFGNLSPFPVTALDPIPCPLPQTGKGWRILRLSEVKVVRGAKGLFLTETMSNLSPFPVWGRVGDGVKKGMG